MNARVSGGRPLIEDDPKRGFRHAGEFFAAVAKESRISNPGDQRLVISAVAPGTVGNESSGVDGGFLVPVDFATEVQTFASMEDALLPFCDLQDTSTNSMIFPKDETPPWSPLGLAVNWQTEGAIGTQIKPKAGAQTLQLNKLFGLVPISNELVEDATALNSYLPERLGASVRYRTNEGILFGSGVDVPLGAFSGGAAITIAKESGQATQTLAAANLQKMIGRLPPGSFSRAIWLIGGDVLQNTLALSFGSTPVFSPAPSDATPGAQASVAGLIAGRPAIESPHAKAFSSQGDVMLVDLRWYRALQKVGGIRIDTSMHVYFDSDAMAFRIRFRVDGAPKLVSPIAPANGSTQLSPFIQLGAR
jgi:HK97 family phage major capsid protein